MSFQNENSLIQALQQGNTLAFEHVVKIYSPFLMNYAVTLTNNSTTANDILQNVFLKLWEKRKYLLITTSLKKYLFKCVKNEFLNQYKKDKKLQPIEEFYLQTLEKVVLEHTNERTSRILKLIPNEVEKLPSKCQQIFLLSKKEGLTNKEIASYLDISVKTVEAQLTKAFKILRNKLHDIYYIFWSYFSSNQY
ncbi:RNA polymerase sigma factor [Zhouia sp. PK063]|uniref:RNA polymerase sigma factor n=1 Tax=Zhouia sp. PK063 TaxID=3373602 RepID=UPI0037B26CE2